MTSTSNTHTANPTSAHPITPGIPASPIIVVGAGWAGLAAAFTLARQGYPITLLDAAPQAGGRARAISFGKDIVDNGQHLLMGAYSNTLQVLEWLNIPEASVLHRSPLTLSMFDTRKPTKPFYMCLPKRPSFLSILMRANQFRDLSLLEGWQAAKFCYTMLRKHFQLSADMSVQDLLFKHRQPPSLIAKLWKPIALAALSTPIKAASAQVFLRILQEAFFTKPESSHWLFPTVNLSDVLPSPILQYLAAHSHSIFYHQRVQKLIIENDRCTGVATHTDQWAGQAVILATPPHITAQLLQSHPDSSQRCAQLITDLSKFHYQPITTVYLRYAHPIHLAYPMMGMVNSTGHWIFDRAFAGQPNLLSVVITGTGSHRSLSHADLVKQITAELAWVSPRLNTPPLEYRVVCEKRAAFSCDVDISGHRPGNAAPVPNLLLAGDYTNTGYPATLEGAIQSGMKAAQLVSSHHAIPIRS